MCYHVLLFITFKTLLNCFSTKNYSFAELVKINSY